MSIANFPGSMISQITGKVIDLGLNFVVIEINGLGYCLLTTPVTSSNLSKEEETTIHTQLVVREDSLTLYGFTDKYEREMFNLLQTVTGVGPRLAMAALSVMNPDDISSAISNRDTAKLSKIPGVGKRVAERLIVELHDKVLPSSATEFSKTNTKTIGSNKNTEIQEALIGLGFSVKETGSLVDELCSSNPEANTSQILKLALSHLGSK